MATTDVEIANQSLLMLGQKTIQDLAEDTPEGLAARTYYDSAKEHTLRDIKPSFAVKRSDTLALAATQPTFGWEFAFALPADNQVVIGINNDNLDEANNRQWRVEGQDILVNRSELKVKYIYSDSSLEAIMDSSYVKALAAYLAYEMAYTLTESDKKIATLFAMYESRAADARATYGLESSTVRTINDQLTIVRAGGSSFGGTD